MSTQMPAGSSPNTSSSPNSGTPENLRPDELRQVAIEQLRKKRGLQAHIIAYVAVNLFLVGIWLFTTPGGFFWPIFPILGWGIGVAFNIWDVYSPEGFTEEKIQREIQRIRRE